MPSFNKGGAFTTPFGINEFLRDPLDADTKSYTVFKDSVPTHAQSGSPNQRVLQPGTVMAKILTGKGAGKIGPFQAAGTVEQQTITKTGTWTATTGTYRLGVTGSTDPLDHADIAVGANATAVQAALQAFPSYDEFLPTVTGGPLGTAPLVVTFGGGSDAGDVPQITFDGTLIVGGTTPSAGVVTGIAGTAGSDDGRGTLANIVGLLLTAVPWQLLYENVEVSVVYDGAAVQGWCIEYDAAGNPQPLSNTTAAAMQRGGAAGKSVDISWH